MMGMLKLDAEEIEKALRAYLATSGLFVCDRPRFIYEEDQILGVEASVMVSTDPDDEHEETEAE